MGDPPVPRRGAGLTSVAIVEFGGLRDTARELLGALGFLGAPPFPNFAIPTTFVSTVGHIVYATPLAVAYAAVSG